MTVYEIHIDGQYSITLHSWKEAVQERDRLKRENPSAKVEIKSQKV